jgi:hypothetical protein
MLDGDYNIRKLTEAIMASGSRFRYFCWYLPKGFDLVPVGVGRIYDIQVIGSVPHHISGVIWMN